MRFEVSIDMSASTGPSYLGEVLHQLADDIEQYEDEDEPEGAGNVEDAEGKIVGFWEVRP